MAAFVPMYDFKSYYSFEFGWNSITVCRIPSAKLDEQLRGSIAEKYRIHQVPTGITLFYQALLLKAARRMARLQWVEASLTHYCTVLKY